MTLNVSVDDAQRVHILEHSGRGQRYFHSLPNVQINFLLLHVQQIKQTSLSDVLRHDHYVGDLGHDSHQ